MCGMFHGVCSSDAADPYQFTSRLLSPSVNASPLRLGLAATPGLHAYCSSCRLFEAAEADLAAIKKVLEDSRLQGFVVRLRGLPYSATAADIKQFFSGVQLSEDDDAIVFAQSVDGRPTGEAYVELADERALSLAMTRHKELMGNRYIEIFNSSKVDKLQAVQQARFLMQSSQNRRSR